MTAAILSRPDIADVLRQDISDADLEAAAEETALSYTYQTSEYHVCCQ